MSGPEEALDRARAAVRAQREAGSCPPPPPPAQLPSSAQSRRKLLEWAFIEPEVTLLRSTRRYGAPITATKRLLRRALAQYLDVVVANQSRFNLALLAHLEGLEERIEVLEAAGKTGAAPVSHGTPDIRDQP